MISKTYYIGQVPVETIVFTVKDERAIVRSLSAYTSATVLFQAPDGTTRTGGTATITNSAGGQVTYTFGSTTIFDEIGDYKIQLKLINSTKADYCDIAVIKVIESLEV
jgi:hypothetical protein